MKSRTPAKHRQSRAEDTVRIAPAPASSALADPDRRQHDHREHDDQVLDDQEAERDAAVEAVDLALVGEQLDDDDGARKGERDRDIGGGDRHPCRGRGR
jgi:hypothetical protein